MIAIVDYGMGNLRSVEKALQKLSHHATITAAPAEIRAADHLADRRGSGWHLVGLAGVEVA